MVEKYEDFVNNVLQRDLNTILKLREEIFKKISD